MHENSKLYRYTKKMNKWILHDHWVKSQCQESIIYLLQWTNKWKIKEIKCCSLQWYQNTQIPGNE